MTPDNHNDVGQLGGWLQTRSGRVYHPQNPQPESIRLTDIAHALGMLCRFGGHTDRFYCPTEDQRILTSDLRWVCAGDLRVGDRLLAFDETAHEAGSSGKPRRRFRPSVVTYATPVKRRVVRLEMSDGSTVKASEEHPWLAATKVSNNQSWQTAGALAAAVKDGRVRYMNRFMDTWSADESRDAGWLAGIYDGEGHASFRRSGVQSGMAQLPGLVLDKAIELHRALGFDFGLSTVGTGNVQSLQLRGGWRELARLLGTLRPHRLLNNFAMSFEAGVFAKQLGGLREPLQIVSAYDEGEQWVAGLETSTHTYLCEGFGAHNSVAEHSVHVSFCVPVEHAMVALMHDATEAYVTDVPRPLKHMLGRVYADLEELAWTAICQKFGLNPVLPACVKEADNAVLLAEREALLCEPPLPWTWAEGIKPAPVKIECWDPATAKRAFLERYMALRWAGMQELPA